MRVLPALLFVACSSPDAPPESSGSVAPAPARHEQRKWSLSLVSERTGPCSASDPPCKTTWTAQWNGSVVTTKAPNPGADPVKPAITTSKQLSRFDLENLTALITSPAFVDGMTKGFACQGTSHDPEVTLSFEFAGPAGGRTTQFIENCTRGPDAGTALPSKILTLLR